MINGRRRGWFLRASRALDSLIKQRQFHFVLHHSGNRREGELFPLRLNPEDKWLQIIEFKASELLFIAIRLHLR